MLSRRRHRAVKQPLLHPKHMNFLKEVGRSFNPRCYKDISERMLGNSFRYFLTVLFVVCLISFILFIPKIFALPDYVEGKLDSFTELNFDFKYESEDPVVFGEKRPIVIFDPEEPEEGKEKKMGKEKVRLTVDKLSYRFLFERDDVEIDDYKNIKQNSEGYGKMIFYLVLTMSPALFALGYIFFAVKYLIMIFALSIIVLIITRIARFEIEMPHLLNIGFYTAVPMMILEIIPLSFRSLDLYIIPIVVFVIYFALGTLVVGSFENTGNGHQKKMHKKGEFRPRDDYIDINKIE